MIDNNKNNSIQLRLPPYHLLLLPRDPQPHPGASGPAVHGREGAPALAPVDGVCGGCESPRGREGGGGSGGATCRVVGLMSWWSMNHEGG